MSHDPNAGRRPLRPLLPSVPGRRQPPGPPLPKRHRISAACDACRKRKAKCTGERPRCSACATHDTACRYSETEPRVIKRRYEMLKTRVTAHEELFEVLRSLPEEESFEVFRRIRTGGNAEAILAHVRNGNLLMQLSVTPETRRRYVFPYRIEMPRILLATDSPYLRSLIYETTFEQANSPHSSSASLVATRPISTAMSEPYLKPYHAAELVDPLLSQVIASKWTSVTSDETLLRSLLATYFLYMHPFAFAIDKDLFLEDMIAGRSRFCSSLLVNAVLAAAFLMHRQIPERTKFWRPDNLGYKFMAEAKRLWELERLGKGRVTTIQASIHIHIVMQLNGIDKVGFPYHVEAIAMANELGLFKKSSIVGDEKMQKVRTLTAWSLFSWQAMNGYYMYTKPLLKDCPEIPLPDPEVDPAWYGQIWIRYPASTVVVPIELGNIVHARTALRVILNDIAYSLFEKEEKQRSFLSSQAMEYKSRLDDWYHKLPTPMSPKNIVFPLQLEIHLEYYSTMIALFQPGIAVDADDEALSPWLEYWTIELEIILRLYYLRHSFEYNSVTMIWWLIFLANITIKNMEAEKNSHSPLLPSVEESRSTLILCATGIQAHSPSFPVAQLAFRALMGQLKMSELQILMAYATGQDGTELDRALVTNINGDFPLPIIKLNEDPNQVRLTNLIRPLEEVSISSAASSNSDDTP